MGSWNNVSAKVNVRLVVMLVLVAAGVGFSLIAAREAGRSSTMKDALKKGLEAFDRRNWPVAVENFSIYLQRDTDDVEVMRKYAKSLASIRPITAETISRAISAYRRICELDPREEVAPGKLAELYAVVGSFEALAGIARARLDQHPDDRKAPLWLAEALVQQGNDADAREVLAAFINRLEKLPEKHIEYVQACVAMSLLPVDGEPSGPASGLDWLDRAVEYMSDSAEALAYRGRFLRQRAHGSDVDPDAQSSLMSRAQADLMAADAIGTKDPRIRLLLAREWLAHEEFDRALAEVKATDELPANKIEERFFDLDDWTVIRFQIGSEVARRRGDITAAVALTNEALESISGKRHRVRVLPFAVRIYALAGNAVEARRYLDEYVETLRQGVGEIESPMQLAVLRALVASLEGRPDVVIDTLEPALDENPDNSRLLRLMAGAYARTGQTRRAIDALDQYLSLNPDDAQATYELARQYARSGQWARAHDQASRAESLGASSIAVKLLRLGSAANLAIGQEGQVDTGRLEQVAAELAILRDTEPNDTNVRIIQSLIADRLGKSEEAEEHLKLAIEECEDDLRARIQLAIHYRQNGQTVQAIDVCHRACDIHSETAMPWLLLSDLLVASEDLDDARDCLTRGLDAVEGDLEKRSVTIKLALLELVHGDRVAGIELLTKLATEDEREIQSRVLLLSLPEIRSDQAKAGQLIAELKQAEGQRGRWWRFYQASAWLSSDSWRERQADITVYLQYCIDTTPRWPAPVVLLAGMYNRVGQVQRVEELCRRGLLNNPSSTEIANVLLDLLYQQKRFSEAQEILSRLTIDPRSRSEWQVQFARETGDILGAIDTLKLRVANDDQDARGRIELARLVYQEMHDVNEAFQYLKEAQAIDPASQTLVAVKTSILREEGKPEEALQVLDDYVADQNDLNAYWMRAVYLAEEGQLEEAESDYLKLTTFPEDAVAGYGLLGNFYARTDRLDKAIDALESGLKAYPNNISLQRALMSGLFERNSPGDSERANQMLSDLRKDRPLDADLMWVEARRLLTDPTPESLASAREILEQAIKFDPQQIDAQRALVSIVMQQGEPQKACDYAIEALKVNHNDPVLLAARARAELALGYAPTAAKFASEALREDPNTVEAYGVLVNATAVTKDDTALGQARTMIDSAVARDPNNEPLLLARARVLSALEQPGTAIPELEVYCQTEAGKNSVRAIVMIANLYRLAGDNEKAAPWLEKAEQLAPESQAVIHARVLWLVSQKSYDDLRQISAKYTASEDQDLPTILAAAQLLLSLEDDEVRKEGVKLLEHAVSLSPKSKTIRVGLASALYITGDIERAKKVYQELLDDFPDDVRVLNDLAWILQEQDQDYETALELANKGLNLSPDSPYLLDTRGTIYSKMPDRLADAKSDFQQFAQLAFRDPAREAKSLLKLVRVCVDLEEFDEAKTHAQSGLKIDKETGVYTEAERRELTEVIQRPTQ